MHTIKRPRTKTFQSKDCCHTTAKKNTNPKSLGYTRTKFYVLKQKPISCCRFVQLVLQLSSCSSVSAAAEASFSALQAICQDHSDNKGARSSSRPCHYHHTGVLILTLNSKRLPPLRLLDMTTLVMQPTAARAI